MADRPRSQRHDRPLQGSSGPADRHAGPWPRNLPEGVSLLVPVEGRRREGRRLSDRSFRRRLRLLSAVLGRASPDPPNRCHPDRGSDAITTPARRSEPVRGPRIKNVILMGVHTNLCVLGRPFGLRNQAKAGKNVVLKRDLTDTMYNSPQVAQRESFHRHRPVRRARRGVRLPDDHVERFHRRAAVPIQEDKRPLVVFISAENEYKAVENSAPVRSRSWSSSTAWTARFSRPARKSRARPFTRSAAWRS